MTHIRADRPLHSEAKVVSHLPDLALKPIVLLLSLLAAIILGNAAAWAASTASIALTVTPSSVTLASGAVQQFTATVQGTANTRVNWSASAGTITNSGLFTAPVVAKTTAVTVTVTSAADPSKSATATVAVVSGSAPLINTVNVPKATIGQTYSFTLAADGGKLPYQWRIASGSLPSGIQLDSKTGVLSGTAESSGQFSFTAQVTDAGARTDTQNFNLNVSEKQSGSDTMPPQQSNFDGPAELPRVYVSSAMSDTPSPGKTWSVSAGGDLQQALNNAACGDTIALQAGATFTDRVEVPAKNCDDAHWITVRTSAPDSALPAEGMRITPCYAGVASLPGRPNYHCSNPKDVMAKIVMAKTGCGPFVFDAGANHYRFVGLEVTRTANSPIVYALISMTPGFTADHLVFDRMWLHGTARDETTKGIQLGGSTNVALVDSYLSDFHCTSHVGACTDSAGVGGGIGNNPMGPYKIVNNFLEAAGENILFGGAAATVTPADIEIRSNHMFKPLTWMKGQPGYVGGKDGYPFIVKNLFELKNAQRVLLEGNVMENSWGGFSQMGYGVLLTPKNHDNVCPVCQVTDVTIRYGTISHVASGIEIGNGLSDSGGAPLAGQRYSIHDLVIDDINGNLYNGFGNFAQVSMGKGNVPVLRDVSLQHITAFPKNALLNVGDKTSNKMSNFNFLNNIVSATDKPFTSTGGGSDNCAYHVRPLTLLDNCFAPYQFTSNALIAIPDSASDWPADNYFPDGAHGIFVNYNGGSGGDYHLVSGSPYKNAGTDGKDLGADIDAVLQYTATAR
jgi:hypothetical protein